MDTDLLQLAKDAQVTSPVPDVQTLKAYVPIAQAHASFKAGQYQAAMTEANGALAIEPKFAPAFWAMGVSAGMLGQWDQAIANLQTAVKIDKNYNNGNAALKWAQAGQKAAKKGESPKDKAPVWE
jgi:tetratricopeptide (TPR) repeat protein